MHTNLFQRSQIEHISVKLRASPSDGGLIIKDRYYHLRKYHSSFVGELIIISQIKADKKPNVTLCIIYALWDAMPHLSLG